MREGNKVVGVIVAVVVVLAIAALIAFIFMNQKTSAPQPNNESDATNIEAETPTGEPTDGTPDSATITFTDDGFLPSTLTVKAGTEVTVKNDSSRSVQFSSDNHPTHTKQSELNLAVLEPGESATFTPTQTGAWGFHDHLNASETGTLTVE